MGSNIDWFEERMPHVKILIHRFISKCCLHKTFQGNIPPTTKLSPSQYKTILDSGAIDLDSAQRRLPSIKSSKAMGMKWKFILSIRLFVIRREKRSLGVLNPNRESRLNNHNPLVFPTGFFEMLFRHIMICPQTESKPCPLRSGWSRCTTCRWWPGRNRRWGADRCGRAGSRGHSPRGTTVPAVRFPSASRWGGLGGHPDTDRSVAIQAEQPCLVGEWRDEGSQFTRSDRLLQPLEPTDKGYMRDLLWDLYLRNYLRCWLGSERVPGWLAGWSTALSLDSSFQLYLFVLQTGPGCPLATGSRWGCRCIWGQPPSPSSEPLDISSSCGGGRWWWWPSPVDWWPWGPDTQRNRCLCWGIDQEIKRINLMLNQKTAKINLWGVGRVGCDFFWVFTSVVWPMMGVPFAVLGSRSFIMSRKTV